MCLKRVRNASETRPKRVQNASETRPKRVQNALETRPKRVCISDHYAIYSGIETKSSITNVKEEEHQILSHVVQQKIGEFNWNNLNNCTEVNELYEKIMHAMNTIVTSSTVIKKEKKHRT